MSQFFNGNTGRVTEGQKHALETINLTSAGSIDRRGWDADFYNGDIIFTENKLRGVRLELHIPPSGDARLSVRPQGKARIQYLGLLACLLLLCSQDAM